MKAKEFYYQHNFLDEKLSSTQYNECNKDEIGGFLDKFYRFLLKRLYNAKRTAIDYCNKIAYLQFDYTPNLEDERLLSAQSRIVEIHYPNIKTLVFSLFRRKTLI